MTSTAPHSMKDAPPRESDDGAASAANNLREEAVSQASEVVEKTRDELSSFAQETMRQGNELVDQAFEEATQQADAVAQRVSDGMRSYSDECMALAQGRPEDAPHLRPRLEQAGRRLEQAADRLDDQGYRAVLTDVQDFARRRPVVFLLGAAVAGFAIGRVVKTTRAVDSSETASSDEASDPGSAPTHAQMRTTDHRETSRTNERVDQGPPRRGDYTVDVRDSQTPTTDPLTHGVWAGENDE